MASQRTKWKVDIKIDSSVNGNHGVDWVHLAEERMGLWTFLKAS
jgi:hypothetical protein